MSDYGTAAVMTLVFLEGGVGESTFRVIKTADSCSNCRLLIEDCDRLRRLLEQEHSRVAKLTEDRDALARRVESLGAACDAALDEIKRVAPFLAVHGFSGYEVREDDGGVNLFGQKFVEGER